MNKALFISGLALLWSTVTSAQTDSITLPFNSPEKVNWQGLEKHYFSPIWETEVVTNVSVPSLEVFTPVKGTGNGAAVIVAPGGGLFGLSIESEGKQVAQRLAQKGFTAFVLKYRLVPTGSDGVREISEQFAADPAAAMQRVQQVLPYSVADGLEAVAFVRNNAKTYEIDPKRIGFMGFSAGGAVTMGVGYQGTGTQAPDFIVPVYPWTDAYRVQPAPKDAPPMLIICATDDPLGLANGSIALYTAWHNADYNVALHMYNKGGHGFGMKTQGIPSDHWIERFFDWYQVLF